MTLRPSNLRIPGTLPQHRKDSFRSQQSQLPQSDLAQSVHRPRPSGRIGPRCQGRKRHVHVIGNHVPGFHHPTLRRAKERGSSLRIGKEARTSPWSRIRMRTPRQWSPTALAISSLHPRHRLGTIRLEIAHHLSENLSTTYLRCSTNASASSMVL